jgi:hypothetical protein
MPAAASQRRDRGPAARLRGHAPYGKDRRVIPPILVARHTRPLP